MAKDLALGRSFYAWIAKLEMTESDPKVIRALPKMYPTSSAALFDITNRLCEDLWGTPHYSRACYWNEIFDSTSSQIDEGVRRWSLDFMKKLFIPKRIPKAPDKNFILRKLESFMIRLKVAYDQIDRGRKGFPTYNYFRRTYKDQESAALARSLDWLAPSSIRAEEIEDMSTEQRHKKRYILACAQVALGSAVIGTLRSIMTLLFGSKTVWSTVTGAADIIASGTREAITRRLGALEATIAVVLYLVTMAFGEQTSHDIFPG